MILEDSLVLVSVDLTVCPASLIPNADSQTRADCECLQPARSTSAGAAAAAGGGWLSFDPQCPLDATQVAAVEALAYGKPTLFWTTSPSPLPHHPTPPLAGQLTPPKGRGRG